MPTRGLGQLLHRSPAAAPRAPRHPSPHEIAESTPELWALNDRGMVYLEQGAHQDSGRLSALIPRSRRPAGILRGYVPGPASADMS